MSFYRGRGRGRGRGGSVPSGRLARSGIKTKSGYRRFDSQRVKDVEPVGSEDETGRDGTPLEESEDDALQQSSEEYSAGLPKENPYNSLLQSLRPTADNTKRRRKRLKTQTEDGDEVAEFLVPSRGGKQTLDSSNVALHSVDDAEPHGRNNSDGDDDGDDVVGTEDGDSEGLLDGGTDNDNDSEDGNEGSDPYEVHFASVEGEATKQYQAAIESESNVEKRTVKGLGNLLIHQPKLAAIAAAAHLGGVELSSDMHLKQRLAKIQQTKLPKLNDLQQKLIPYISNYTDVFFGGRTPANTHSLRTVACLHALNHILKGRDKILRNNARSARTDASHDLDLRDQGFTRPKVLILVETRQMASKFVDRMVDLFEPEQQENKQRFKDSFTEPIDDSGSMPEDYRELFDGNNDNNFLTAIKFTRKTLKFFSSFYASDIILASPLGLRRIIEHDDLKKRDYDFLSSIELVIVDQADAMYMQSWENLELIFNHLNLQLREAHGCDFSRVKNWYLDGNAKHFRQTIVFSNYMTPEMNRLFNTHMVNIAGKVKVAPTYDGAIVETGGLGIKQTFSRFDSSSPTNDPDARFRYFTSTVLPSLLRLPKPSDGAQGILVFIPSYYDFLRVRNFFATSSLTQNVSFGAIHDYSEVSEQRRARSHYLSGRHSILLYTQRAHHFFRLRLRGVKRIVMYGLPDSAIFYEELVSGFIGTSIAEGRVSPEETSVRGIFGKWDGLRLERITGSARVKTMLSGKGDTFDFI